MTYVAQAWISSRIVFLQPLTTHNHYPTSLPTFPVTLTQFEPFNPLGKCSDLKHFFDMVNRSRWWPGWPKHFTIFFWSPRHG